MKFREDLFKYKNIYDSKGSSKLFIAAMKESVKHHEANCDFYDRLLKREAFNIDMLNSEDDLSKIPCIPANFFKHHEVMSISESDVSVHATSSGTRGQKSQVFLDKSSVDLGTKMIIASMKYHKLISIIPTNYILLGYEPKESNEMGNTKVLTGMTRFAPAKKKIYAIKNVRDEYKVDFIGIKAALKSFERQKLPVRILGFPSYLYMMLKMIQDTGMKPLKLNKKSIVLMGGGWKAHEDKEINKEELYHMAESLLGIPKENIRDYYSAVEHSVAYPECKYHHMHVPIWSRVIIRDVKTLEPLGFGEEGFINFISPLVSSMPISSILMSDIAVLRDGNECGCGITTPYFEIIGRAGSKNAKTCAMTASELMRGGESNG